MKPGTGLRVRRGYLKKGEREKDSIHGTVSPIQSIYNDLMEVLCLLRSAYLYTHVSCTPFSLYAHICASTSKYGASWHPLEIGKSYSSRTKAFIMVPRTQDTYRCNQI